MKVRMSLQHASGAAPVDIDIVVHPEWAPLGAERFEALVKANYFNECPLYRNIPGFIIQWGIPADPSAWKQYGEKKIKDDPVKISNKLGTLSFATSGPNARGSQIFVNLANNDNLDEQGFSPFAELADPAAGLAALAGCAEVAGVDQAAGKSQGAAYFSQFPSLSVWKGAAIVG